jgi:hypothetical protein
MGKGKPPSATSYIQGYIPNAVWRAGMNPAPTLLRRYKSNVGADFTPGKISKMSLRAKRSNLNHYNEIVSSILSSQ